MAKIPNLNLIPQQIKDKYQISGQSLFYNKIVNSELDVYKGEPKDEIKITLGSVNNAEFTPDIEIKRWNEVSFKLKPKLSTVATKDKDLSFEGDKVKFKTPKEEMHFYDLPVSEANPEGAYEIEWILNEKPLTNVVEFDIETQGVEYFYQPELTQKEIDDGAFRPDNVIGSYAVYASEQKTNYVGGKEYKVGKIGHIFRPKIIDSAGTEVWGDLHIENGILSVTIPQDFLDKGIYPIIVDPTFGFVGIGATTNSGVIGQSFGDLYPFVVNVQTSKISIYASNASAATIHLKALIYNDSAGVPNALQGVSAEFTIAASAGAAWVDSASLSLSLNAGNYHLGWIQASTDTANSLQYRQDGGLSATQMHRVNDNYASPAGTYPGSSTTAQRAISIYATTATTPDIMGNPNQGVSGYTLASTAPENLIGFLHTAPLSGTLASMSVFVYLDGTSKLTMALYDSSKNLIAQTAEINPTSAGWSTATFSSPPSVTQGTQYYLAVWCDYTSLTAMYYTTGAANQASYSNNHDYTTLSGVFPNTFGVDASAAYNGSIYATYTASGGGVSNHFLSLLGVGS